LEHLETSQNFNPKTLKNILDHLKTFFNWLRTREVIDIVPSFPRIETREYEHTWFDADDQIRLLEVTDKEDRPIIAFLMLHGCRPGEARALKVKNVDIKKGIIRIKSTFSGKEIRDRRKGRGAKPLEIPIHCIFTLK
jgi:integrase